MQEVQRELVSSEIKTKKLKVLENKFFYDLFKRIFDLVSSLCGLIVFSPLFLIIAMLIKLDSKGPAFFHI